MLLFLSMKDIIGLFNNVLNAFISGDLQGFTRLIGPWGVYAVIFAESGLLVGFFLPGDSLLFTAGFFASPAIKVFNIWPLVIGAWIAAVVGDNVGYEFGKRIGKNLFKKEKSFLFNPHNVLKAQAFYEKHGGKAITLARFIPVVRTFVPIVAGIGHMDHKKFTLFNFIGGTLWVWGMTFAGYYLGTIIPEDKVDHYLLPIVFGIILLSILPPLYHLYKENKISWRKKLSERLIYWFKYKI